MDADRSPLKEKTNLRPRRILAKDFHENAQIFSRHGLSPPPVKKPRDVFGGTNEETSSSTNTSNHSQTSVATVEAFKPLSQPESSDEKSAKEDITNDTIKGDVTMHDVSAYNPPLEQSQVIRGESDKENQTEQQGGEEEALSSAHSPTPKRNSSQLLEQAPKRLKLDSVTLKPFVDPSTVPQRSGPKKPREATEDHKHNSLLLPGERTQASTQTHTHTHTHTHTNTQIQTWGREIKVPNEYEDHFRMIQQSKAAVAEKAVQAEKQSKRAANTAAVDNLEDWRSKWRPIMRNAEFYFLEVSQANIDRVKPLLDHIGSNISHFFENKINYIVTRQSYADMYKKGKLDGLPSALLTAHKLQLKVWGYEKLEKFLRHLLGDTFVDNALGMGGGNKDVGLGYLLKEERVAGPSDRDPEAHRQDFHYLRGPHVYIWDLDKSMRSIMIKEYNKDDFPIWCDNFMGKHQFLRSKDAQKRAESMTARATRSNSGMKDIMASGVQPISNSRSIAQSGDVGLRNGLAPVVASVPSRQVALMKRNILHEPRAVPEREQATSGTTASPAFKRPSMRQNSSSSSSSPYTIESPTKLSITKEHLQVTSLLLPSVAEHILNTKPVVTGVVDLAEVVMSAVIPQYAQRTLLDRRFLFRVIVNEGIERRMGREIDPDRKEYDRLEITVGSIILFFAKMIYKYSHLDTAWDYGSLYLYDELRAKLLCECSESRVLFDCDKMLQAFDAARTIPQCRESPQERKAWCENCKQEFTSFAEHVQSRTHRRFATDESNFAQLDDFIGRMKARDSHLSI